jgi:hypothetical protein
VELFDIDEEGLSAGVANMAWFAMNFMLMPEHF